jgi:MOSC domain-containing protein YiiM
VQASDNIELIQRSTHAVTIQQVVDCYYAREQDLPTIQAILEVPFLRPSLRAHFLALCGTSQ